MRDYIVAVDENGQPYLAHAGENGGWKNRATKYLGKFPNLYGNGKTAYAYTQQQLRAMQNYARGGARKAQNTVNDVKTKVGKAKNAAKDAVSSAVANSKSKSDRMKEEFRKKSGVGAKDRMDEAAEKLTKASEQVKNTGTINKRAGGQELNAAQQKARDDYASASRNYKEAKEDYENSAAGKVSKVTDKVKDKLGVDEKERAEKAWAEVPKRVDSNDKDAVDKFHKAVKAQDEYRETPLGKAEYLTERAKEIATGQDGNAKEVAEKAAKAVKSKADKMKEEFRKKTEEAKDKLGFDEKKRLDEAKDELDKTINLGRSDNVIPRTKSGAIDLEESGKQQDAARTNVDKRRDEYHETPIGKVSKAKDNAEEAVDKAKEKVSNTADKVSASIKETMDKIEREVDFATAPKAFRKMIKNNAKNKGISEEEAKQELIEWTENYYTNVGDLERRDRYLEALKKA